MTSPAFAGPRLHPQHWDVVVLLCRGLSQLARTAKSSVQLCHDCAAAAAHREAAQAASAAVCLPVHCE